MATTRKRKTVIPLDGIPEVEKLRKLVEQYRTRNATLTRLVEAYQTLIVEYNRIEQIRYAKSNQFKFKLIKGKKHAVSNGTVE